MSTTITNERQVEQTAERRRRRQLGRPNRGGRLPTSNRSWGAVTAGVLVIVVAGMLGALAFFQAGQTTSVIAVRDAVAKGETIERDNLISKQVAGVDGAVAVEDLHTVVGKTVGVGLTAGQIVTTGNVSENSIPGPGQSVVGLAVRPAQMPGEGLVAGDFVRVVVVPAADDTSAEPSDPQVIAESAQVLAVSRSQTGDAVRVVTVIASESQAGGLATASAAGRLAVIKIPTVKQGQ